ncbi:MAG TPA: hypothetical protein VGL89_03895 [Candidatus Koribacter sp.]|jgi:hypothetical protein
MHNNIGIEKRCLVLWSEVVSALENRVTSVNHYVPEANSRIACEQLSDEAVQIKHAAANRSLVASLDLNSHSIQINKFEGNSSENRATEQDLPLSLLGDGELYVTDGHQLLADPVEVAKFLMSSLLGNSGTAAA